MANPVLNIDTLEPDRPTAMIDGELYAFKMPVDFGLRDLGKLKRMYADFIALEGKDPEEFSEADETRLDRVLRAFVAMILIDCPEDVQERMKDRHRMALVEAFGTAAGIGGLGTLPPAPELIPQNRASRRSTSATSSQPSSASTASRRARKPTG